MPKRSSTIPIVAAPSAARRVLERPWFEPGLLRLAALPPLTLYVHVPWCVRKCPYCDFNSHEHPAGASALPEAAYLEALRVDLEAALPSVWGRRVSAVFFGGGTPSLLSAQALDAILAMVRALLPLEADAEVTLEANPGAVEAGKFREFRALGINRLSVGVQSFDDASLAAIGRIHDARQARHALDEARASFENINLDLMYALPHQSLAQANSDLREALAFHPAHLSLYHLTIESNTVFAKYPPALPDEDESAQMQEALQRVLDRAGLVQYEVSAYARANRRCRHNLNYWNFGDYLGIGPGAHSKLSFAERVVRQARHRQPGVYLERAARGEPLVADEHEVSAADLAFEFMLNGLRLVEGFPVARFAERTGLPLEAVRAPLERAERDQLIERDALTIRPTALGLRFLNDLQALFLPE